MMKKLIMLIMTAALALTPQTAVFAADGDIISDFGPTAAANTAQEQQTEPEVGAEIKTSIDYQIYEMIAGFIADRYIDESYSKKDIMTLGISKYLEENGEEAIVAMLKAAVQSLDDYSDFYTREEFSEYTNNLNKTFYGLGITMQQSGEYVEIVDFAEENSLAEKSGFKIGDKIIAVDGINIVGFSITEARNLIVGDLGTTVLITVLRDGKEMEITGTRTAVNNSTVSGGVLEGNIGYVKIASFSINTANEFIDIITELKNQGVKNLILDLRNNPGGLLSIATSIAEQIVPKGKIVDVVYRDKSMNYTYYSELASAPFRIVALVNGNTASSAEILASAIQDSHAGILMGEQTYGKAVIQNSTPLNNGMVFKITIGQYITRNGNEIDHVGLIPDKDVENYTKRIDTTGYTKFDFLTPVSVGSSGVNVSAAKERLAIMNYFIGNTGNDVFNTDLVDAVKAFQRDNSLTDSGVLDVPTQIKLKEVFESLETTVDVQMQEAYKYFGGNIDDLYGE